MDVIVKDLQLKYSQNRYKEFLLNVKNFTQHYLKRLLSESRNDYVNLRDFYLKFGEKKNEVLKKKYDNLLISIEYFIHIVKQNVEYDVTKSMGSGLFPPILKNKLKYQQQLLLYDQNHHYYNDEEYDDDDEVDVEREENGDDDGEADDVDEY